MPLTLSMDEQLAAAVVEGVRQTLRDPAFVRLVVEQLAGEVCYLTAGQLSKLLGRSPRTVARWLKANKISVTGALGPKDPRVKFSAVQAALDAGTVRAAKPKAKPPGARKGKSPVQIALPTPTPVRAVVIRPDRAT